MLPTYERLFSSARILNRAIESLEAMPHEARIDLLEQPRDKWLDEMRERLRATAVRSTNIIEISYLSKRPRTAETVVNAIVDSYSDFIEESHKSVASDLGALLAKHLDQNAMDLKRKTDQLLMAKQSVQDLGISQAEIVHPAVHRVNELHSELVSVQQARLKLQASMAALQNAIQSGGNLQQHLLSLEPTIGKEVVLGALGLSTKDGEVVGHLERMLFEEQASLEQLSMYYLESHPEMVRLSSRVSQIREQVANYSTRQTHMASEAYNEQLGQMLFSLVNENLRQTTLHEQALQQEYGQAEGEAMMLASQWERIRILEEDEKRLRDLDGDLKNNLTISCSRPTIRTYVSKSPARHWPRTSPCRLDFCGFYS